MKYNYLMGLLIGIIAFVVLYSMEIPYPFDLKVLFVDITASATIGYLFSIDS